MRTVGAYPQGERRRCRHLLAQVLSGTEGTTPAVRQDYGKDKGASNYHC